jgi:1-acyl-sn-glycerol-3-phosphate acyltransferase
VDEARVIPLHGDSAGRFQRAGRAGGRRSGRPLPGLGQRATVLDLELTSDTAGPGASEDGHDAAVARSATDRPAWEHRVAAGLTFLRRRLEGQYEVDEYGFDRDLTAHAIVPLLEPLYRSWFRVEVSGIENVPASGAALLVANHAGGLWPLDAAMTAVAVHVEHPAGRFLRTLGSDQILRVPGLGALGRKAGSTLACVEDVDRLLAEGELVGVWPEGVRGIGKPFVHRYRVQRFGRGGFVQSALRAGAPIVPVSIVGSEEVHPVLGNAKAVARLLGLPYFPLTPTFPWLGPLGLLPLPAKWHIEFGEPITTDHVLPDVAIDPLTAFDLADRVRETIQASLYRLLAQRRSVWR